MSTLPLLVLLLTIVPHSAAAVPQNVHQTTSTANHTEPKTDQQIIDAVENATLHANTTLQTVEEEFFQKTVTARLHIATAVLNKAKTLLDQAKKSSVSIENEAKLDEAEKEYREYEAALKKFEESKRVLDRVKHSTKAERGWEENLWTVRLSELRPDEHVTDHFGIGLFVRLVGNDPRRGVVTIDSHGMRWDCRGKVTSPSRKNENGISCLVRPPPGIAAHICMAELRVGMSGCAALRKAEDVPTAADAFAGMQVEGWRSAWFDAQDIYCRHSPDGKYIDLAGQHETCR